MPGVMDVCSPECAPFMLRSLLFCDVSDELRAGSCLMPEIRERALIDHHATNPAFADVNLIDGDAAATGVMVVELMDELLRIPLTPSMAENLYVGITTGPRQLQLSIDRRPHAARGREVPGCGRRPGRDHAPHV